VNLNQLFFPLDTWRQPNIVAWDGYGRFSKEGEGPLVIVRNDRSDYFSNVDDTWLSRWSLSCKPVGCEDAAERGRKAAEGRWPLDLRTKPKVFVMAISRDQHRF
jgi:hypothetical protein